MQVLRGGLGEKVFFEMSGMSVEKVPGWRVLEVEGGQGRGNVVEEVQAEEVGHSHVYSLC